MAFTTLFFDLDDTLYPNGSGLWEAIRSRMGEYMVGTLGLPEEEAQYLRRSYYQNYGTTLRGLQKHHHVDADEYLAYVHDLPLEHFIKPDPALRLLLQQLPQRKFIFTNADANHASRVLQILGAQDCFTGIIDIRALDFACKPELSAYQKALVLAGSPDPSVCMMMDDSPVNLAPAHSLGFATVLVSSREESCPGISYTVPSLHAIPTLCPELWKDLLDYLPEYPPESPLDGAAKHGN
jgi:putative hydrolase of the HAD superfamily